MKASEEAMEREVSVIIPAYNGQKTLRACVESILRGEGTPGRIEVLIVDDCSTDGTEDSGRRLEAQYPGIVRYFRLQENGGASAARNYGLARCKGRYAAFVDCDDAVEEGYIDRLLSGMRDGVDLVCCGYFADAKDGRHAQKFFGGPCLLDTDEKKEEFLLRLLDDDYGQPAGQRRITAIGVPWAKLYRTDVIRAHGVRFPEGLRRSEDNLFNMTYVAHCGAVCYIDEPLYGYSAGHSQKVYYAFTPETYSMIQRLRDAFFDAHPSLLTERVRAFRCAEKAVMLNSAVKYLLTHGTFAEAARGAAAWSKAPEFRLPPEAFSMGLLTAKQRAYLRLHRLLQRGRFKTVCALWKVFLSVKRLQK